MKLHENKLRLLDSTTLSNDSHYNDVHIRESRLLCFTSRSIIVESQKAIQKAQKQIESREKTISATV